MMTIITNRSETNYKNFIAFTELSMVLLLVNLFFKQSLQDPIKSC